MKPGLGPYTLDGWLSEWRFDMYNRIEACRASWVSAARSFGIRTKVGLTRCPSTGVYTTQGEC